MWEKCLQNDLKMETLDGRAAKEDDRKNPFHPQEMVKECVHQTHLFLMRVEIPRKLCEGDPSLDSLTMWWPDTHRIQRSCFRCVNQGKSLRTSQMISSNVVTLKHFSARISISSCIVQVVRGRIVQVHFGANIVKPNLCLSSASSQSGNISLAQNTSSEH